MSEEGSFWATLTEKLLGIILLVVGILLIYFTATSTEALLGFTSIFAVLSIIVIVVGVLLIIVKPPE